MKRMMTEKVLRDYEEDLAEEVYDAQKKKQRRGKPRKRRNRRGKFIRKKPVSKGGAGGSIRNSSVEGGGNLYCKSRLENYDYRYCVTPALCFLQVRQRVVKDCEVV